MAQESDAKTKRKIISTRIKNSTKPIFRMPKPVFFRCSRCGSLTVHEGHNSRHMQVACCGVPVTALSLNTQDELLLDHQPVLEITGGYDANVALVTVGKEMHAMQADHYIEWIYLYTFQGGQFKFLKPRQTPTAIFALAEEDAYVYCDRLNCMKCKFNCKRGFTAYAYCNQHGLCSVEK